MSTGASPRAGGRSPLDPRVRHDGAGPGVRPAAADGEDADPVARLRAAGCVFAEDEARLLREAAGTPADLAALVARRVAGTPLEQVLGWAQFAGLRIAVEPGVFVPRRRSELLAREAVRALRARRTPAAPGAGAGPSPGAPSGAAPGAASDALSDAVRAGPATRPVVVDLCCGSGAVGAAVAHAVPGLELHAADVDPAAVRCARRNLEPLGGTVHEGDLWAALPVALRGRVDVLVANAPYVPTAAIATMPPEARAHEPRVALDGGDDGLDVVRRVALGALPWLAAGGHLVVETSVRQAPEVLAAVRRGGLDARVARSRSLDATAVVAVRR